MTDVRNLLFAISHALHEVAVNMESEEPEAVPGLDPEDDGPSLHVQVNPNPGTQPPYQAYQQPEDQRQPFQQPPVQQPPVQQPQQPQQTYQQPQQPQQTYQQPQQPQQEQAPAQAPAQGPTLAQLQTHLGLLVQKLQPEQTEQVKRIIGGYGVSRVSDIPEAKYGEFLVLLQQAFPDVK